MAYRKQNPLTVDGVLFADANKNTSSTAAGTATQVLTSNGAGVAPTYQAVSASGAITTITGNSGGAESPSSGNFNVLGTGSITVAGTANTETVQLTGLTNHAVLVGAGTATITKVGPTSTAGQVLQSAGAAADPAFSTATYPLTTTVSQLLYSSATNTVSGLATANRAVITTNATGVPVATALATDGQLIIGSTAGAPAAASLTAGTGISITPGSNSITIAVSGAGVGETITGDIGGAISPTAGNWNIIAAFANNNGSTVNFSGSGSTLTLNLADSNQNIIMGSASGNGTITATNSSGFGYNVMPGLTSGVGNSGFGASSLHAVTSGTNNSGFGRGALNGIQTGVYNAALGDNAGSGLTGSDSSNIMIGPAVNGTAGDNNTIRIGNQGSGTAQQNKCFIAGIEGVSVSNLNIVTIDTTTGQLGSQAASNVGTVTQFDVLVGGASGAIASVGPGSAGQILRSGGNAANPAYSTATYPATAGTSGKILISDGTNIVSSTPTYPNSATGTGTILRADGTNWVATTATYPNTTTSQQILYSTADNVVGQLTTANSKLPATNSSGTLAMRAFSVVTQTFSASGTYTPTTGMLYCKVRIVGGGGGGGGAAATTGAQTSVGSGGGAGEYAEGTFSAATVGASQTVTIGAAGAANSGAAGGNGGTSSLGALITCGGGTGGVTGAAAGVVNITGSLGGTGGSGGSFRSPGRKGYSSTGATASVNLIGGEGGDSQFGTGGLGAASNAAGVAALGYGSGGSGALNFTSQSARSGGAGTAGLIVIDEYVIA